MSDLRSIVDRELERVELRPFTLEAFHQRRDRKRRNQRIAAGAIGLAIAIALIAVVVATSIIRSSPIPAAPPSPTPATSAGGLTFATGSARDVVSGIALLEPGTKHPRVLVSGEVTAFDWSPDGTELAYMHTASRGCLVSVLDVDSGRSKELTSCGGGADFPSIDWAPDGTQIAFVTPGGIQVIAPDGTGQRVLPQGGSSPTWSPDGKRIAFIASSQELYVAAADGTEPVAVASHVWAAAWSPYGATIAILRDPHISRPCTGYCYPNFLQVSLIRADGSGETKLARQPGCCIGAQPTMGWSPDGSRISLTGVRFQVIEVATGESRIVHLPMVGSVRPSWRPVP